MATFGFTLTAARIVTVDANRNIGGITFGGNNSGFGYTLSSGSLLLTNAGTIQVDSTATSGTHTDTISSAIAIQGDGGSATFSNNGATTRLLSIGAVTGVSTAGNTTTLTLNGSNTGANAITGIIGDGGQGKLAVVKSGAGSWTLSGGNSFTGGTTINSGTLKIGNATALGGNAGTVSVTSGAALDLNAITMTATNALTLNGTGISSGGALINSGTSAAGTYAGAVTLGSASSIIASGNNITLTNANSITGTNVDLTVGGARNTNINGIIATGTGKLTKQDSGLLSLGGANTFGGGIDLQGGTLQLSNAAALGTGVLKIGSGITITSSAANLTTTNNNAQTWNGSWTFGGINAWSTGTTGAITLGNSDITVTSTNTGGTLNAQGAVTGTSNLTLNATTAKGITFNNAIGINNTGTITNASTNTGAVTISTLGSNVTGLILNSTGNSTLALTASSTGFTGDTTVTQGTLNLRDTNSLQNSVLKMNGGSVTFGTSITTALASVALGGLDGSANINLNNTLTTPGAVALTLGNSNLSNGSSTNPNTLNPVYSGVLSNTNGLASLTKVGTNTQTLTGNNSYGGATKVSGGTLFINGSTSATSAVSVALGATLGGSGTVGGATTIASGGFLTAGANAASIGTLTINNGLTLNGTYTAKVGADVADRVTVTGVLTHGASDSLILADNSATAGNYTLASYTSKIGNASVVTNPFGQSNTALHGTVTQGTTATTLALFNVAAANTLADVNLGNIRAGTAFTSQALTITNTKAANVSEGLNATAGATTGVASVSGGPITNLSGGASSTSILVGLTDTTAGAKSGTVSIGFASNGTGTSGFTNSTLASQTVNVSGTVYDYASASFSSNSFDFGDVNSGQTVTKTFSLNAAAGTRDSLSGTFSVSGGELTSSDIGAVTALGAGGSRSITLSYLAGAAGAYTGSLTFNGTSDGAALGLDDKALAAISFNVTANVLDVSAIPEPSTYAALAGLGVLILAAYHRRKQS